MARQKRRGAPDLPVNQEDKPGPWILKTETGKQAQVLRGNPVSGEFRVGFVRVWWGQALWCSQRSCMDITEPVPMVTTDTRLRTNEAKSPCHRLAPIEEQSACVGC